MPSRRSVLAGGAAAALGARPFASCAAIRERGGVQWTVALPEEFVIARQLESVVRVRVEQVRAFFSRVHTCRIGGANDLNCRTPLGCGAVVVGVTNGSLACLPGLRRGGGCWRCGYGCGVVDVCADSLLPPSQVLAAEAPGGLQCKLLLVPFGQQASGSLGSDEQLALAKFFYDGDGSPAEIARTMLASAGRSPGVLGTSQLGEAQVATDGAGKRYVTYSYESNRCAGEVYDGECLGAAARRTTFAAVTMSSVSQFRTKTERERMAELGQVREVNVLWLLTASAPAGVGAEFQKSLQAIAASLSVP